MIVCVKVNHTMSKETSRTNTYTTQNTNRSTPAHARTHHKDNSPHAHAYTHTHTHTHTPKVIPLSHTHTHTCTTVTQRRARDNAKSNIEKLQQQIQLKVSKEGKTWKGRISRSKMNAKTVHSYLP